MSLSWGQPSVVLPSWASSFRRSRDPSTSKSSPWEGFRYLYSLSALFIRAGRRELMADFRFWESTIRSLAVSKEIDLSYWLFLSVFLNLSSGRKNNGNKSLFKNKEVFKMKVYTEAISRRTGVCFSISGTSVHVCLANLWSQVGI